MDVEAHLTARKALIAYEDALRSDAEFRANLSPAAAKACALVARIRAAEHASLWTPDKDNELYPGMMFSLAKQRLETTTLWKIARRMPKGALLHCHLGAMVEVDWLFTKVLDVPGIHISASEALHTEEARARAVILFKYCSSPTKDDMWSDTYKGGYVDVVHAADTFPGGRDSFISWLCARSVISEEDSLQHHLGVDEIWRKLQAAFPALGSLLSYEPVYRLFLRKMLSVLAADGVRWVEIRDVFHAPFVREGRDTPDEDFVYRVAITGHEIDAFQQTPEGQNFWGGRIIWTALRSLDPDAILSSMKQCITAKQAHPELIAGFDLVGQEDLGHPLTTHLPVLTWFTSHCASLGLTIPYFFHAGECLGSGDSTDHNLYDALLLRTRRIGHAFSLYKHPHLIDLVKERHVLVESCPISNEVLRLSATVLAHPLPALLARGVQASLSNDDPALLGQGTSGMSHDFWQALQAWESLGLEGLGALAENSVRYAAFEDQDEQRWIEGIEGGYTLEGVKGERMRQWKEEWEVFCRWVVQEFDSK